MRTGSNTLNGVRSWNDGEYLIVRAIIRGWASHKSQMNNLCYLTDFLKRVFGPPNEEYSTSIVRRLRSQRRRFQRYNSSDITKNPWRPESDRKSNNFDPKP
jgi:hypothetical protein